MTMNIMDNAEAQFQSVLTVSSLFVCLFVCFLRVPTLLVNLFEAKFCCLSYWAKYQ